MGRHLVFAIGGIIVGLILLAWLPWYVTALIIVAAIAIPVTAYRMLDPSQRRRLREMRRRGQLGR
jgi:asparagine N-glycosylation enzyme membrane subunit Stt3